MHGLAHREDMFAPTTARPRAPFPGSCHIQVVVDRDKEFLGVARAISQLIGLPKALRTQNRLPHTSCMPAPKCAWASAKFGSSSAARLKRVTAALAAFRHIDRLTLRCMPSTLRAKAWWPRSSGIWCSLTVASDSPTRVRNLLAIWLRAFRTSSFFAACACSSSRISPVRHLFARKPRTYWLPRLEIEPSRTAALLLRSQISLRDLQGKPRIRRLLHQPECPMNALVGNQAEEWRLFKLNRQPLAKRLVKGGVACRVREIGEDDACPCPSVLVRR